MITFPPQHSTIASKQFNLQPAKKTCLPPEQVPKAATFPFELGSDRTYFAAASRSPITWSSETPPSALTAAATSSGVPCAYLQYRSGEIAR